MRMPKKGKTVSFQLAFLSRVIGALTEARSMRQRLMRERCESGRWFGIRRILVGKIGDATAGWHEPEDRDQRKPNNPANWTACQWDTKIFSQMKRSKVLFSLLEPKEKVLKGWNRNLRTQPFNGDDDQTRAWKCFGKSFIEFSWDVSCEKCWKNGSVCQSDNLEEKQKEFQEAAHFLPWNGSSSWERRR